MFESFSRSWQLVKASYSVLRADRELMLFPVLSMIGVIGATIIFLFPMFLAGIVDAIMQEQDITNGQAVFGLVVTFFYYLTTYTIIIFSNTALIGAALMRLDGQDPTVSDGFRIARSRMSSILGYAAISATVGMILNAMRNRDNNILAQIMAGFLEFAWNIITFLVIPILVIENVGPIEAIKRSGSMLKQTWGEQLAGSFSIGGIFALITILLVFLGIAMVAVFANLSAGLAVAMFIVMVIVVVGINLVGAALSSIFCAALYKYASTGNGGGFFDETMLAGAFYEKPKRF